jgi:hypothetical protein
MHEVQHRSWHEMTGWSVCWFESPLGLDDDRVVEGVSLHDGGCRLEVLEEKDSDVVVIGGRRYKGDGGSTLLILAGRYVTTYGSLVPAIPLSLSLPPAPQKRLPAILSTRIFNPKGNQIILYSVRGSGCRR